MNKTSNHRNNTLGLADLSFTMSWLDAYCQARPRAHFAEAVGMLLLGSKPGPTAHGIEVTSYGSADKSCAIYRDARDQAEPAYWAEFRDWLGGYLSGVNAMSLNTNNVLHSAELTSAVQWLDDYCNAHSLTPFSAAVEALVVASQPARAQPITAERIELSAAGNAGGAGHGGGLESARGSAVAEGPREEP